MGWVLKQSWTDTPSPTPLHPCFGEARRKTTSEKRHAGVDQSLEFVAETSILAEMKIEYLGTKYFPRPKNQQAYFYSMKIEMMDLCECKLKVETWYSLWILVC